VVPESELREAKARIRELERLLGKKTLETEILKDALELTRSKKLISRSLLPGSSKNGDGR
jgi:transposase